MAGLTALANLEVLAKETLLKHPLLEFHPLVHPLLIVWVGRMCQIHSFRRHKAVKRRSYIEKQFVLYQLISTRSFFRILIKPTINLSAATLSTIHHQKNRQSLAEWNR